MTKYQSVTILGPMSEIYEYKDYREFLRHYVSRRKRENPDWTIAGWARELGLLATTSITKILNGQREPGERICQKLTEYFRFNSEESKYFDYLVHLNKCTDSTMREVFTEKLLRLTPTIGKLSIDEARLQIVAEWVHMAIRQMAGVQPLPNDPAWIARQLIFESSVEQVQQAIENLLQLGMLIERDGKLSKSETWLASTEDIPSKALRSHHSQMIENAKQAIEKVPVLQREIRGMTMAVPLDKMDMAKAMIRQFTEDIAKLMNENSTDQVYQLNVQFFPLTQFENKSETHQEIQQ